MSKVTKIDVGGLGLPAVLAVVFVVLKLTGLINWSWWWVLAPIWIPWAILVVVLGLLFTATGIALALDKSK